MNRPIRALSVFCMALFALLMINISYLQFFQADDLNQRASNRRVIDAEFARERGSIVVAGRPIARSVEIDDQYDYQREYPQPLKYAHITGFFSYIYGRSGVEQTNNAVLSGSDSRLFVSRVIDLVKDAEPAGGSVGLTINPAAQTAAYEGVRALGDDVKAAVVAIEPATGKILAMVSSPTFDPRPVASHDFDVVRNSYARLINDPGAPMRNRAIGERLPPGSTFKLVTAAAALADGYEPDSLVQGGRRLDLPQTDTDLVNQGGSDCGGARISLTQALEVSCNVSFGALALDMGAEKLIDQAERFGFGQRYFDDLPAQAESTVTAGVMPDEPQTAISGIGQSNVAATPLQMAMVAAGIANYGSVMKPYLVDVRRAPDLSVLERTEPEELRTGRAMSSSDATDLINMMVSVVDNGTGRPAAIPNVEVAGKTGTAQSAADRPPYAWFVSFAPAQAAQVAVAVLVEDAGVARDQISGGGLAAPIAKRVMEAVLNQ